MGYIPKKTLEDLEYDEVLKGAQISQLLRWEKLR